jgi:hypothetical protein
MGRGIAGLISRELEIIATLDASGGGTFGTDLQSKLLERSRDLDIREHHVEHREGRSRKPSAGCEQEPCR